MVSAKQTGRGSVFKVVLAVSTILAPALAMAQAAPIDPYAPAPPPIVAPPAPPAAPPAPPAPAPAPAPSSPGSVTNSGTINNNNNTNTVSPVITANPTNNNSNTSNNTNTNDNKSNASATATNNNTIYIYPPAYPPPAPPPVVAPPTSLSPPRLVPPPLVPGPAYGRAPYYAPQRIRLNCRQLCAAPPPPVLIPSPMRERIRYVSIGTHITALGMANQPLAGWGTLYGGGFQVTMRSRGRFGFEMSQDFLRGELRASDGGNHITRNSFPIDFTFRGYILPNLDRYHFNMYFGAGFGAIASSLDIPAEFGTASQSFLEWTLHADAGAELRWKWIALGLDAKVMGIVRDRNFGDGAYYGGIQDGPVPAKTWGLQGRGHLAFWF